MHAAGEGWSLGVRTLAETVPALLAAVDASSARLLTLATHRATLEDLFVAKTGRKLRDA